MTLDETRTFVRECLQDHLPPNASDGDQLNWLQNSGYDFYQTAQDQGKRLDQVHLAAARDGLIAQRQASVALAYRRTELPKTGRPQAAMDPRLAEIAHQRAQLEPPAHHDEAAQEAHRSRLFQILSRAMPTSVEYKRALFEADLPLLETVHAAIHGRPGQHNRTVELEKQIHYRRAAPASGYPGSELLPDESVGAIYGAAVHVDGLWARRIQKVIGDVQAIADDYPALAPTLGALLGPLIATLQELLSPVEAGRKRRPSASVGGTAGMEPTA